MFTAVSLRETAIHYLSLSHSYFADLTLLLFISVSYQFSQSAYLLWLSHYTSLSSSLSVILQCQWEQRYTSFCKLLLQLNQVSVSVINSMMLKAFFSFSCRPQQCLLSEDLNNYLSHTELLNWVSKLKIQLDTLILMKADELKVLQLLYFYRHLNSANLNSLLVTNLILH